MQQVQGVVLSLPLHSASLMPALEEQLLLSGPAPFRALQVPVLRKMMQMQQWSQPGPGTA